MNTHDTTVEPRDVAGSNEAGDDSERIQRALDMMTGGGCLSLASGDYWLTKPLELGDKTTLRGAGRSTRLRVAHDGFGVLARGRRGVTVRELSVVTEEEGHAGVVFEGCGDSQILDVYAAGFRGYGVWVRANSFLCEIRGCKVAGNTEAGICLDHLEQGGRIGDYVPNLVTNCIAFGGGHGFEANRAIVVNFVACQAFQTRGCGFYLHSVSNSVLLSGCRTFKIVEDAVRVEGSHEINISSSIFCWQRRTGIVLSDVCWGTVCGNNVIDSGSEMTGGPTAVGISLQGGTKGVQVTGNSVFNWGGQGKLTVGIKEDDGCANNGITNNTINWFEDAGVVSKGTGSMAGMNIEVEEPAYLGSPESPDPRFSLDAMEEFIRGS